MEINKGRRIHNMNGKIERYMSLEEVIDTVIVKEVLESLF